MRLLFIVLMLSTLPTQVSAQLKMPHLLRMQRLDRDDRERLDDSLEDYLIGKVPEIRAMVKYVYCKSLGDCPSGMNEDSCVHKLLLQVESEPDPKSHDPYRRNYYQIYVGESTQVNLVRWLTFLIPKGKGEIIYYEVGLEKYMTLSKLHRSKEWKQSKAEILGWLKHNHCD